MSIALPVPTTVASIQLPKEITIAVDTEFEGAHTLTVQAACRLDAERIAAQVYQSPLIPGLPSGLNVGSYLPTDGDKYGRFFQQPLLRPSQLITSELSPGRILRDLLGLCCRVYSRYVGQELIDDFGSLQPLPPNVTRDESKKQWRVPETTLRVVYHFQPADFYRCFGRSFWDGLLDRFVRDRGEVAVECDRKLLKLVECRRARDYTDPIVEYLHFEDGSFYAIKLHTVDTWHPFGPASLDDHCRTFLQIGKSSVLTAEDKSGMRETFHRKTVDAYGYAITDPVNTLLVHEQMERHHQQTIAELDIDSGQLRRMRGTLGARAADAVSRCAQKTGLASPELKSQRGIKRLMRRGGRDPLKDGPQITMFGVQNASIHGGLLFSRSPTKFWHDASEQLRDVDLSGC